jgi:GTP-binding protein HflX
MVDLKRTQLSVQSERALLAGAFFPGSDDSHDESLGELESLARTAGAKVVAKVAQRRLAADSTYLFGRGKAQEIAEMCVSLGIDVILCDNDLSPAQVRNLEQLTDTKVIDRTELILDIFATRARTRQARCQVELAQLEYSLPRLKRLWTHLSRYEGGIGMRGPGEMQIEVDRRLATKRIQHLKKEISEIQARKSREVASRAEEFTVSLVGYTNAGKSTLMNAVTNAGVFVEDRLFATLDTKTHTCVLDDHHKALLSDTVGFIRHLPHNLVASFHATLEEVLQADLLLHVVDISASDMWQQVEAVHSVLKEIGAHDKPMIVVLNKMDKLDGGEEAIRSLQDAPLFQNRFDDFVVISALRGIGIQELKQHIADRMDRLEVEAVVNVHAGNGKLLSYLSRSGRIAKTEYAGEEARVRLRIDPRRLAKVKGMGGSYAILNAQTNAQDAEQ